MNASEFTKAIEEKMNINIVEFDDLEGFNFPSVEKIETTFDAVSKTGYRLIKIKVSGNDSFGIESYQEISLNNKGLSENEFSAYL